jgi:hypothetical protein
VACGAARAPTVLIDGSGSPVDPAAGGGPSASRVGSRIPCYALCVGHPSTGVDSPDAKSAPSPPNASSHLMVRRLAPTVVAMLFFCAGCGGTDISPNPTFDAGLLKSVPSRVDVAALSHRTLPEFPDCRFEEGETADDSGSMHWISAASFVCGRGSGDDSRGAAFNDKPPNHGAAAVHCKEDHGWALCDLDKGLVTLQVQARQQENAMKLLTALTRLVVGKTEVVP